MARAFTKCALRGWASLSKKPMVSRPELTLNRGSRKLCVSGLLEPGIKSRQLDRTSGLSEHMARIRAEELWGMK
jgi:hypothetical protein